MSAVSNIKPSYSGSTPKEGEAYYLAHRNIIVRFDGVRWIEFHPSGEFQIPAPKPKHVAHLV
jgi:hypothetical protein